MIKNEDLKTLSLISVILDNKTYDLSKDDINTIIEYNKLIEKIISYKKECSNKNNNYNKTHKERHRILNNLYGARKSGNTEREEYWKKELDKLNNKEE